MANKSYVLLRMYDSLRKDSGIKLAEWCGKYEISVATFRRYISFLRGYFDEVYGREIEYSAEMSVYRLKAPING